ncbi:DUF6252 family protein [Flavobacterium sp. J372]|uniref:DUF6252 family protein n=1 Tax=Flavobacterium sp. J372 TaxID=2898436 RepID=UPI0021512550|nr:DUF6252 family protein [Flavobacterium sp. J372]MCR5861599.1 DUF6252 family protein [Flavobacterium sp. J372]
MKKLITSGFAIMSLMAVTLTACGDDDAQNNNNTLPDGTFIQGKVDGTGFSSMVMGHSTATATRQGTGDATFISVQGSTMEANTMVIVMHGITATGTYTIDAEDESVLAYFNAANSISYDTSNCSGATGTLNITHLDNTKVEGTFNFVGKDDDNCSQSKTITEGSFRGIFAN